MYIGVLEDNAAVCDYISTALKLAGHTVDVHTTGPSLLARLTSASEHTLPPYDLVMIDLNLPGALSGQDVIQRIRSSTSTRNLPMLIVSGTGEHELTHIRTVFPSVPILRKPFKYQTLLQTINQCSYLPW